MIPEPFIIQSPSLVALLINQQIPNSWIIKHQSLLYLITPCCKEKIPLDLDKVEVLLEEEIKDVININKISEIFFENQIPFEFYEKIKTLFKEKLKLYPHPTYLPLKETQINTLKNNYQIAEATLIYAYSLLNENLSKDELLAELTYYLVSKGVKPINIILETDFINANTHEKSFYLKNPSWVQFKIEFYKNYLKTILIKTVSFGSISEKNKILYNHIKTYFKQVKTNLILENQANLKTKPLKNELFQLTLSSLTNPKKFKETFLNQINIQKIELLVPYVLTISLKEKPNEILISDLLIKNHKQTFFFNQFGDDLLLFQ